MKYVFLIRHGQTAWTKEKRYQGHTDIPLDETGQSQAALLAERLKRYEVGEYYASPLIRARQTAEKIAASVSKNIKTDPRLVEMSFGAWEGKTAQELIDSGDEEYAKWAKGIWTAPPGGESIEIVRKRLRQFLSDVILDKPEGSKTAVISHGGAIKMLIYEALNFPLNSLWSVRIDPASVSLLIFAPQFCQLAFANDTSHLDNHCDQLFTHFFETRQHDSARGRK